MPELLANRFALLGQAPRTGGAGEVHKAIDLESNNGQLVAVKYIRSAHPDDPLAKTYFDREVSSLRRLQYPQPHPNIVELLWAGFDEKALKQYIVLEWIERDLNSLYADPPWSTWAEFSEAIALPLADALSFAHLAQIQHRDIKPENVLIADEGSPKLADFGIAKRDDVLNSNGITLFEAHTPPYAPPDRGVGAEYTRDVWALAALSIRSMYQKAVRDYKDLFTALDEIEVPTEARSLLHQCLSFDPELRPQNGAVLADHLRKIQSRQSARAAKAGTVVILSLTKSASITICSGAEGGRREAEQAVLVDLSTSVFGKYQATGPTRSVDRETIQLFGREWQYIIKLQSSKSHFVIISARRIHPDYHAKDVLSARQLTGLCDFAFRESPSLDVVAGARILLAALEEHASQLQQAAAEVVRVDSENDYFEHLLRLLEAQEELAQGDRRPLTYISRRVRGREVEFELSTALEADLTGELWDIRLGGGRRIGRGEVLRQGSHSLTLLLFRLPRSIPGTAELVPNLGPTQVAHDRQLDAVRRTRNGTSLRPDLKKFMLDPSQIGSPKPVEPAEWIHKDLDDDKKRAVAAALGAPDFLLVQGPPGTGKTTFIAELIAQFLVLNPAARVLVVSQTHVAVDNALERLQATVGDGVIRLGKPDDPRVSTTIQPLLLDQQMRRWATSVRSKAESFVKKTSETYSIPETHLTAALELQRLGTLLREVRLLRDQASDVAGADEDEERTLTGVAQLADPIASQDRIEWLEEQIEHLQDKLISVMGLEDVMGSIDTASDIDSAIDLLLADTGLPSNILTILRMQGEWLQRIQNDRQLATAFLKTARIVGGTCVGFLSHPAVRDLEFDLCILDEASKATATEALVPLARSKRWIMVGDTRQLPPMDEAILRDPDLMARHHLDSEMINVTLFDRLISKSNSGVRLDLRRQYRMIRPIGDLISTCFYQDLLKSPRETGLPGLDRLTKPVLWIDTSEFGRDRFEEPTGGPSHLNRLEARETASRLRVLDRAISAGIVTPAESSRLSVLVMAPYSRQIEELEGEIAQAGPLNLEILIKSVDAVQGRESDLSIFSVTRSNVRGDLGFLAQPYWRRINVALSRARFGLTIIGDAAFCRAQPGALRDVLSYIDDHPSDCELRGKG